MVAIPTMCAMRATGAITTVGAIRTMVAITTVCYEDYRFVPLGYQLCFLRLLPCTEFFRVCIVVRRKAFQRKGFCNMRSALHTVASPITAPSVSPGSIPRMLDPASTAAPPVSTCSNRGGGKGCHKDKVRGCLGLPGVRTGSAING